jgi:hypothetical protein
MESTTAAGIVLLSLIGAGLAMSTALAGVFLHRLHLEAQSENTPDAGGDRQIQEPSRPVAENRA